MIAELLFFIEIKIQIISNVTNFFFNVFYTRFPEGKNDHFVIVFAVNGLENFL